MSRDNPTVSDFAYSSMALNAALALGSTDGDSNWIWTASQFQRKGASLYAVPQNYFKVTKAKYYVATEE